MAQTEARYAVVRIDNGIRNPHTGIVQNFKTLKAAVKYCRLSQPKNQPGSLTRAWFPWGILDRETGEKRDWRDAAADLAEEGIAAE